MITVIFFKVFFIVISKLIKNNVLMYALFSANLYMFLHLRYIYWSSQKEICEEKGRNKNGCQSFIHVYVAIEQEYQD